MEQEDRKPADEFALLGLAHALDFLGDRRQIGLSDAPVAQERRLFEASGVEIVVMQRSSRRHGSKPTPDPGTVDWTARFSLRMRLIKTPHLLESHQPVHLGERIERRG